MGSGLHILPEREDCLESFQWLAQEVRTQNGDCLLMKVESFEGLTDRELVSLFQDKSEKAYAELEKQIAELEKIVGSKNSTQKSHPHGEVEKLRRKHAEIVRTDFFDAPGNSRIVARLGALERKLVGGNQELISIEKVSIGDYKGRRWVTRPRPHVDRLGSIWLIRRFIDPDAKIRYSKNPEPDELSFDMKKGSTFGHVGNFCTFETMLTAFDLKDRGLWTIAEIIHEIDLRDSRYRHPEIAGIDAVLRGWLLKELSDEELEVQGLGLFDGLYSDVLRREKASKKKK